MHPRLEADGARISTKKGLLITVYISSFASDHIFKDNTTFIKLLIAETKDEQITG